MTGRLSIFFWLAQWLLYHRDEVAFGLSLNGSFQWVRLQQREALDKPFGDVGNSRQHYSREI
jgi:hypothetical protein